MTSRRHTEEEYVAISSPCVFSSYMYFSSRLKLISPVENQNDLELDFKVFSLLILVVQTLYLMNPTDATLASLSVLKY